MRDNVAREKVVGISCELKELNRKLVELAKELGFEFDDDGIMDRGASADSSLGRLQAQITALVEATGYKETYVDGILRYEKVR